MLDNKIYYYRQQDSDPADVRVRRGAGRGHRLPLPRHLSLAKARLGGLLVQPPPQRGGRRHDQTRRLSRAGRHQMGVQLLDTREGTGAGQALQHRPICVELQGGFFSEFQHFFGTFFNGSNGAELKVDILLSIMHYSSHVIIIYTLSAVTIFIIKINIYKIERFFL